MPISTATLDAQWQRPAGPFWMPQYCARNSPCLKIHACTHARCVFLRELALQRCRLCKKKLGWGVLVKPDPQPSLSFEPPPWVHGDCAAPVVGHSLLRAARAGSHFSRRKK